MVYFWRCLGIAAAFPTAIFAAISTRGKPDVVPSSYIVELHDASMSSDDFLGLVTDTTGVRATRRRDISSSLFHGLSFTLDASNDEDALVKRIASMPGVSWIAPVREITAPESRSQAAAGDATTWDVPHHLRARQAEGAEVVHQMTGVDKLRNEGYLGSGIKVAVVDSGIDYHHPALGGCFGEGCLVSFGADLVGDEIGKGPASEGDPFADCHSHGTHVSGLVAAQENPYGFTGVAPNVTLGHYRVLDCRGRGTTDLFIDAFSRAYDAGADVITASLGEYSGWSEEPWGTLIERIAKAGVPCLVAVGNDGYYGTFYASNGADGIGATGVGSVNQPLAPMFLTKASFSSGSNSSAQSFGWTPAVGKDFVNGTYSLYPLSLNSSEATDGCSTIPSNAPDLSDKIVLVRRGGCSFGIKAENIAAAGGRRMLIYNNEPSTYEMTISTEGIESAGMVPASTGQEWVEMIGTGSTINLQMVDEASAGKLYKVEEDTLAGGFTSYFTQWGPTNELFLLPTVLAPGSYMMSTFPLNKGGYAVESGTSMATPYLAGCIALLIEAKGKMSGTEINALLSSNARQNMFHDGRSEHPWLGPVIQQGGGHVNIYDAVHTTTIVNTSSISFNDTEHQSTQTFSIQNTGSGLVIYTLGNSGSGTVYALGPDGNPIPSLHDYGDFPETVTNYAQLSFSPPVAIIPAGQSATIQVSATAPEGLNESRIPIYNGYVTINGTNGDALTIPYLGVASNMKDAVILDTENGENYLFSSTSTDSISSGHIYHLPTPDHYDEDGNYTIPWFNLRLSMGSKLVRVDVKPTNGTSNTTEIGSHHILGSLSNFPKRFQPRNPVGPSTITWYGDLSDGSFVPEGSYSLLVRALKIFGDEEKEEDWDVVETPRFQIQYASRPQRLARTFKM
ncbi:peptidase S8/S53 domain-containing protein [Stachybotrys elegans]|uniref:Peptidase S8/S53 domain-containing protein n=1 Tax=Stachybotrys elegans TaxID=80388 RepID=A0A8K0SWL3_9HYPO|nr:peptidase S8/S53 domain-containing protein [Stachybotrys elegans]